MYRVSARRAPEDTTKPKRTALFLAYHYPPVRSAGVERTARFVHHLPDYGYRARVLTTSTFGGHSDGHVLRAWEPLAWYLRLRGPSARRDPAAPARSGRNGPVRNLVRRWLLVPDAQLTWLPAAAAMALRHIRSDPPDILYSTSPPASAHLLGLLLKRLTGLPWVADFRDSWVCDPLDSALLDMPFRRHVEGRMESAVAAEADLVIAATDISASYLTERAGLGADRIRVITNGYEPADLVDPEGSRLTPEGLLLDPAVESSEASRPFLPAAPAPAESHCLRLVHTGSFSFSHPDRSPLPLFAALGGLMDGDERWRDRIRLVLAGRASPEEAAAARRLEERGVAECLGEVDRAAALALQRQADVLVVVDHPRPWPASNLPGKVFEYLATGRPVLALCGPGALRDFMGRIGGGLTVPPDDVGAIRAALVELASRKVTGDLPPGVPQERLAPYQRSELTRRLALCFDEVVAQSPQRAS